MRSTRAILSVKYTPAGASAGRAIAGFLRYVQYRDHHELPDQTQGIEGLVRYVAYRDAASPQGRLFNALTAAGDPERKALNAYVRRSLQSGGKQGGRHSRAVYRLVISPEDARGIDLRALTRATMEQLARDSGELPDWIAAEHRNTAHPHVHVVLPALREVAPGRFRQLLITKPRLAAMKRAMTRELESQRGVRAPEPQRPNARSAHPQRRHQRRRRRAWTWQIPTFSCSRALSQAAARYRRQMEREAERERRQRDWDFER